MKKIFLGLMACAALCACTSDDLVSLGNETQKVFQGDVAYMTVSLNDVGTGTRATSSGYKNGSATEYAVNTAHFYFYDAAGVYVSEASVWDGGNAVSDDGNIEFKSNAVIVLEGLTGKGYPTYVVTVLNKPSSFKPGETLDEMATLLSDAASEGITTSVTPSGGTATDYFVMSTSSYVSSSETRTHYFTTELTESDFYAEPIVYDKDGIVTGITPVEIYVERLAAKVQLGIDEELAETAVTLGDGETGYLLTETVGGDPNNEGNVDEGATEVYVKLIGWALNGTAKHSLMMKDVTPFVSSTGEAQAVDGWTATEWNIPTDFRSYWGASFNYGLTPADGYPKTSGGASASKGEGTTLNDYLDYVSYNDLKLAVEGGYDYCAENTNTAEILGSKNSSGITHVLLAAEACDIEGNPLDLVRYQGELFTPTAYLNYVMSELTYAGSLNVYTLDESTGEKVYTHIDGSYIQLVNANDGYVTVGLADEDEFEEGTYYKNNDGTFEAYADADAVKAAVESELTSFNTLHPSVNAYTGGKMYYSIPIEHLNNTYPTEGSTPSINEANYGIVRNHWYVLTITSLENLGKGVYDPDEVIIPNIDDEQYYYVGANINILSWKLVDQSVSL